MKGIFQTSFVGQAADIRIGDAAYPTVGQAQDGAVLVEAPIEVGAAQGWARRIDLEAARAAEGTKSPDPSDGQAIVSVNAEKAQALVAEATTLEQLAAYEAAERTHPKHDGGRASVLRAIEARRAQIGE